MVGKPPANGGDGDVGLISGLGRSPGGGHGNPLQYSCLENPMDRGAWWATAHGVAKSRTRIKRLRTHAHNLGLTQRCPGEDCHPSSVWTFLTGAMLRTSMLRPFIKLVRPPAVRYMVSKVTTPLLFILLHLNRMSWSE